MKSFDSPVKNSAYWLYRIISPIIDPLHLYAGVKGYLSYVRDIVRYKMRVPKAVIRLQDMYPIFSDNLSTTPFDAHYFFQGVWLLDQLNKRKPTTHVDVASKYELSGYISLITRCEFVDIRPIDTKLHNLSVKRGDITHLPYANNSVSSLSSLHVIEHIGLGRYGDEINPEGTSLACKELVRVLKPKGYLYISTPIGKPRICFNAHRIHNPLDIITFCKGLKLIDFSVVDDDGRYIQHVKPSDYRDEEYACGMYIFQKTP